MHELAIATGIVDGVLEEAERRGLGRVRAIHLRLGPLAGVDRDSLLFSYELASAGTALSDAPLVVEEVEVRIACPCCGEGRRVREFPALYCADCGTPGRVTAGDELQVAALEVET